MESKKDREISGALHSAAAELRKRGGPLGDILKSRDRDLQIIREFANQIEQGLRPALHECESGNLGVEQALQSLIAACRSTLNRSRALSESKLGDLHHVKGYIEGLSAAADFISSMGDAALQEAQRVEALAASETDLDQRRSLGERPESLRVKRKAAELRRKNGDNDGSDTPGIEPAQ
jgi:hypothetical protein